MSSANSPGKIIAENEDLLVDIFSRLPAKSLVRFKSASKSCLSLISSPHFVRLHSRQNSNPKGIFLRRPRGFNFVSLDSNPSSAPPLKSLDFFPRRSRITILQSCNGLLLCSSYGKSGSNENYYVCNPATKKFLMLPPVRDDESAAVLGVCLAYEHSKSAQYKVVCFHTPAGSTPFENSNQIKVYSSETGSWRQSGSPFVARYCFWSYTGVFCNGLIYWFSGRRDILCFDVDTERLEVLPAFPIHGMNVDENTRGWFRHGLWWFCQSGGHVHLIGAFGGKFADELKVCELQKDCCKWVVKYHIDLNPLLTAYPDMVMDADSIPKVSIFVFLLLVRKENEDESSLLVHIPGKIISLNLSKGTFRELFDCTPGHGLGYDWFDAFEYFESLASV